MNPLTPKPGPTAVRFFPDGYRAGGGFAAPGNTAGGYSVSCTSRLVRMEQNLRPHMLQ